MGIARDCTMPKARKGARLGSCSSFNSGQLWIVTADFRHLHAQTGCMRRHNMFLLSSVSMAGLHSVGSRWATRAPGEQPSSASSLPAAGDAEHLIVLVNGLWGSVRGWQQLRTRLVAACIKVKDSSTLVVASSVNQGVATYDGIEVCGQRLAAELQSLIATHPSLTQLSVITHSMGGLVARYALGMLYDPATHKIAGLVPRDYISIAGPHLGCGSTHEGESTAHWRGYFYMSLLHSSVHRGLLPRPLLPRSVLQLLALDSVGNVSQSSASKQSTTRVAATGCAAVLGAAEAQQGQVDKLQDSLQRQQQEEQQEDDLASGAHMLDLLVADWPAHGLYPLAALRAFQRRTVYAEKDGDHLVSWASASLRAPEQLPTHLPKPAWLRCTAIVQDCRPLESCTQLRDPAGVSCGDSTCSSGTGTGVGGHCKSGSSGGSSGGSSSSSDPRHSDCSSSDGSSVAAWVSVQGTPKTGSKNAASAYSQRDDHADSDNTSASGSDSQCCNVPSINEAAQNGQEQGGPVWRLFGSKRKQHEPAVREMGMRARLAVLQSMEWRRFDVVFPRLVLGTGHNNIQYNRAMNFAGLPVVQHIISQLLPSDCPQCQSTANVANVQPS